MTYSEKLRSPKWQQRRLQVLDRAGWMCELCGKDDVELHVHHHFYVKGREPWEYGDDELSALCVKHHLSMEEARVRLLAAVGLNGLSDIDGALQSVAKKVGLDGVQGVTSAALQQFIFSLEEHSTDAGSF